MLRMRESGSPKLSATIFASVFATAVVTAVAVVMAMVVVYYASHEASEEMRLLSSAGSTAARLDALDDAERVEALSQQFPDQLRYTLISADGEVLFDSASPGTAVESHKDRPEIKAAQTSGEGTVARRSQTLDVDALYAAVRLTDGGVVRLSETRESLASFAGAFAVPMLCVLGILLVCAIGVSRLLTQRIVMPLEGLDVSEPLSGTAYVEMEPMLERIAEQQKMLQGQNAELARAESMRRDFSANVSHEMKTPLQILSGYSELIANGMVSGEQAREFAEMIHAESLRMQALIDDVLMLSRIDDPVDARSQMVDVDLFALAKEVMERLMPLAARCDVRLRVLGQEVCAKANAELIDQALGNLLSNAMRYSDPGGVVTVSVRKECHPEDLSTDAEAVLSVRDEGCGIAHEEQEKIFERFYRVDKSRSKETGGTGLGLAIAKHAVEASGGAITVDSEPGRGSVFAIHLPCV